MMKLSGWLLDSLLAVLLATAAFAVYSLAAAAEEPRGTKVQAKVAYMGQFSLTPSHGPAGTEVRATGAGLPADTELKLLWKTVEGSWVLEGEHQEQYRGRRFTPVDMPLNTITTDSAGSFEAKFTVPDGWGFEHDVVVVQRDTGVIRNQASFAVDMEVTVSPESGPPGTPINIEVRGMGHRYLTNSWLVLYNNQLTGWMSSVTTGGTARAVIPATGRPGDRHVIRIMHGTWSNAYLNPHQSRAPDRPDYTFVFEVTEGQPVLPAAPETQSLPPESGARPPGDGPSLWSDPAAATVDTPMTIHGRGLPPGQDIELVYFRQEGTRLYGHDIIETAAVLGEATVAADGTVEVADASFPDDLGGPHEIVARAGEDVLAVGQFSITPSVIVVAPTSGPVGTRLRIQMKGVGWRETDNIYHVVYNNAYAGYACGFTSQGDVEIFLPAAGDPAPGWHFIDLYPGLYDGEDMPWTNNFRIPQLTGAEDHPNLLPVFRLAFKVEP